MQCDEGHPTCRNCQKSKRECLGYDPIFKQQPGPANIQPAPSGNAPPPPNPASTPTAVPSNPYQTPQSYPGTGGTFIPAAGAPYGGAEQSFEHSTSLDPALAGGDPHMHMAQNSHSSLQPQRKGACCCNDASLRFIADVQCSEDGSDAGALFAK